MANVTLGGLAFAVGLYAGFFPRYNRLLAEAGDVTVGKKGSADLAWHIDHAKKTYLRVLIEHHGGNLRKIANSWERSSEQTIRALIRKLGLADALDRARARKKP